MIYIMLLVNVFLLATGQVLWKIGMSKVQLTMSLKGIIKVIFTPYIFSGGVLYVIATVLWLYILSKAELSRVYPLQSLCYVLGTLAGVFIFNEKFTSNKFIGLCCILIGVFFIAKK